MNAERYDDGSGVWPETDEEVREWVTRHRGILDYSDDGCVTVAIESAWWNEHNGTYHSGRATAATAAEAIQELLGRWSRADRAHIAPQSGMTAAELRRRADAIASEGFSLYGSI